MILHDAAASPQRLAYGLPLLLTVALLMHGCAPGKFATGQKLLAEGQVEEGLRTVQQAIEESPRNQEYRSYYYRQRELVLGRLLLRADELRVALDFDAAEDHYRRVLRLDANNVRAATGLERVLMDRRHRMLVADATTLVKARKFDEAAVKLRPVLGENPAHREARLLQRLVDEDRVKTSLASPVMKSALTKPVSLEFREAGIRSIFEVISRMAGINFVFDKDVRPDLRATLFVKNTTIEDVVNTLLLTNQLEKKVVNENTILVYPNTPAKAREYQELVVKSFYLANADAKQTLNMIRAIVKTRDVYIDEKLNLVVMRDTPGNVRLAEKLVANQDLAEPEVVLEVEVAEIKRSRFSELGITYPSQFSLLNLATTNTVTTSGGAVVATSPTVTSNPLTLDTLRSLRAASIGISPVLLNLRSEDSDANLLANPRIRVKNREKARIHIGDRVPVITTTATANVGVTESVSYLEVGLRLEVEPTVSLDDEVGIKVGLEVSGIVREIKSQTGTLTYQIGTRSAATNLRLKDGETQALAGLINDEDRKSAQKVPGLGDLPFVGRLFASHRNDASKTEVILLITPHIVRNLVRPEASALEFSAGTEDASSSGSALGSRADTPPQASMGQPLVKPAPPQGQPFIQLPPPAGQPPGQPPPGSGTAPSPGPGGAASSASPQSAPIRRFEFGR